MIICMPAASLLLDTLFPYFLSQAIGTLSETNSDGLARLLVIAGSLALIGVFLNLAGFQAAIHHEARVRNQLTQQTLSTILAKDNGFFANQKIGAMTGKFIDFINGHVALQDLLVIRTLTFILNMTIGILIIFTNSALLGLFIFSLLVGILIQVKVSFRLRDSLRQQRKNLVGVVNGAVADTISNNDTVKTFAREAHELQTAKTLTDKYQQVYQKDFKWMSAEGSARLLVMSIMQIIAVAILAHLLTTDQIGVGIAIFVVAYLQRVASQLFTLGEMLLGFDKILLQSAPMTEILVNEPKIVNKPNAPALNVSHGEIRLKNISYTYSDAKHIAVLDGLSLTIQPGERVGLVGSSGAGKSTLTRLLLRFDDIDSGEIRIDGQSTQDVTQESLRENIAYVPQEPALFHRALRDNIAYGKLDATDEEIIEASRAANAMGFINQLPEGFDTIVGERGVKLSGGQRQRIAIARAILKNAPILVLDEATSALDSESEQSIQDSLSTLMEGRTSIVIAHRLSTIAKLDRIVVLEYGKIAEQGSHTELLQSNGIYAQLWGRQSGGFIEE